MLYSCNKRFIVISFLFQYNDLMRKKQIVENDKAKIETVIRELDEKKKEALKQAWESVSCCCY